MKSLINCCGRWSERGATATEYALLISLIALAVLGSVAAVGTTTFNMWQGSCTNIATVTTGGSC